MDLPLSGQVAIVTGASSGIGRATAVALAAEGVRVVTVSPGLTATPMWFGPESIAHQMATTTDGDADVISRVTADWTEEIGERQ